METRSDLLRVEDLKVQFPSSRGTVRAVDGVSLTMGHNEAIGIVGESGSGKSMTALALLWLVPPPGRLTAARLVFEDHDLMTLSDRELRAVRHSRIATVFQDAGSYLNPIMRIGDQIAEAIGKRGSRNPRVRQQVLDALRSVQIADPVRVADAYPHELSGGMQQRAMIASVLIREPTLIIADEPTTALDATVQSQILQVLATLRAKISASLILISHDLAVVSDVCDRVYVMYAGQIIEEGATRDLFASPKHPYTQALIESILDPFDVKPDISVLEGSPPDMADPPSGCRFHPRCPKAFAPCPTKVPPRAYFSERHSARCWLHVPVDTVAHA